jgi:hypothetical protein
MTFSEHHQRTDSTKTLFRQCRLAKGHARTVAFLPDVFAVVGMCLRLKEDDGWMVMEVYDNTMTDDATTDEYLMQTASAEHQFVLGEHDATRRRRK